VPGSIDRRDTVLVPQSPQKDTKETVEPPNVARTVGFWALWIYLFSLASLLNETSNELFGAKPYSTTISGPIMVIGLLCGGTIFRGFRTKAGFLWLMMLGFITLSLPFSIWRSDSLQQWLQYVVKICPLFFFVCAAVITVKQCERLLYAQVIAAGIVIVLVSLTGYAPDGRLVLGYGTFSNPNALALQLLLGGGAFIYLIYRGGKIMRIIGGLGVFIAAVFVFRTGSRGAFVAIVVMIFALFFTLRQNSAKIKMLAMLVVLGFCGIIAAFSNPVALRRLTDITLADRPTAYPDVLYSLASQMAREDLLRRSVELTVRNPLLGVGMGEFPVAVDNAARQQGQKSSWNGTHNSYTQVSSECGIPAAICYTSVLLIAIFSSRSLYREFSKYPGEEVISGMALTLFVMLVSLAVDTFFFHLAYSYYVPVFCGMAVALRFASASHRRAVS
jgi:hypothetical protein